MDGKVEIAYSESRRSERGFSLIEMMIAATVITIGLVAVAGVSAYISRTNSASNTMSILASAAQDQADTLRNLTWDQTTQAAQLANTGGSTDYSSADANHRTQV